MCTDADVHGRDFVCSRTARPSLSPNLGCTAGPAFFKDLAKLSLRHFFAFLEQQEWSRELANELRLNFHHFHYQCKFDKRILLFHDYACSRFIYLIERKFLIYQYVSKCDVTSIFILSTSRSMFRKIITQFVFLIIS